MRPRSSADAILRHLATSAIFLLVFIGAYLATVIASTYGPVPANLWLGGDHGFQLRPEPVIIPLALAFGWPAVIGASVGVLLHNLLFRIVPGGVTLAFSIAQTGVAAAGGYAALLIRRWVPRPYNNLAATWAVTAFFVLVLGTFASFEYANTSVLHEWNHILREVLLPFNVLGLIILEVLETRRRGVARSAQEAIS
jgi:hypothetical protein